VTIAGATQTAGFGAPVTLVGAAADPDSDASNLTYKWLQTAGPTATLTGAATPTLTFTTQTLADAKGHGDGPASLRRASHQPRRSRQLLI
jgi:hypothetical protein